MKPPRDSDAGPAPRRGRRLPGRPLRRDVERAHLALAWAARLLVRERYRVRMDDLVARAGVPKRTLEEYLALRHPEAWTTFDKIMLGLGMRPEQMARVVRRWMRAYQRREKRRHQGEPGWTLRWPWEQLPCQDAREVSR